MFADIPEKTAFRKTQYIKIKEGNPILFQFMDERAERFLVHTIYPTSDGLLAKIPHREDSSILNEEFFNKKYPARYLFRVNVLDVTPYVVNPATGSKFNALAGKVPERDPVDGSSLRDIKPKPLCEVKILENGRRLFEQFNAVISSLMATNPKLDVNNVVFHLQAQGRGRDMVKSVIPRTDLEPVDLENYERYDLELEDFTDDEINMLLRGTGLKKIWEMQREVTEDDLPELDFEDNDDVEEDGGIDWSGGLPGLN